MKSAALQTVLDSKRIRCDTCAHYCVLHKGEFGRCGVRENHNGLIVSHVYGRVAAFHVDPIEKKPLFHFLPGARTYSISTVGCNMTCLHCQNASISQMPVDSGRISGDLTRPEEIVAMARSQTCRVMAYTYTEPAVFWDYAYDISREARNHQMVNVFVTNGFWSKQGLDAMLPLMDAANVDLKSFYDETYRSLCGARLKPVLDCICTMREAGVWVEVTTLIIPGINDSEKELKAVACFLAETDPDIVWHVSRFHPAYRLTDRVPTSDAILSRARAIGLDAGLHYVYIGNVHDEESMSTYCPQCRKRLVARSLFQVRDIQIHEGHCPQCLAPVAGLWC